MGSWGYEIFCSDEALDALEELLSSDDIEQTLEEMLDLGEDYIDLDAGSRALAAAAIIDGVINEPDYDLIAEGEPLEEVDKVISMLDPDETELLAEAAVDAIEAVLSDESELYDLWRENISLFPKWRDNLLLLRGRLTGE